MAATTMAICMRNRTNWESPRKSSRNDTAASASALAGISQKRNVIGTPLRWHKECQHHPSGECDGEKREPTATRRRDTMRTAFVGVVEKLVAQQQVFGQPNQ